MDAKTILLLFSGLGLLLFSGKFLVESSVFIARRFHISTSIIGLTIVAFGTSAPELLVSIQAALQGYPDMAVGNVIGSNISNILLVLGITTIIFPIAVQRSSVIVDWPVMMIASLIMLGFLVDRHLSRLEGAIFVLFLLGYILFSLRQAKKTRTTGSDVTESGIYKTWWMALVVFLLSCGGLALGASLLVDNAARMAAFLGVSERVISISMVALGTSLPELATSIIAAFKRETDLSIGNILGSNLMNIISVLGITSLIKPIYTSPLVLTMDMPWVIGSAILLFLFMIPANRGKIVRIEGVLLFIAYIIYIYFIFIVE